MNIYKLLSLKKKKKKKKEQSHAPYISPDQIHDLTKPLRMDERDTGFQVHSQAILTENS